MKRRGCPCVYFIKPVGFDGPIKIGTSTAPELRRMELEKWSPFPLEPVLIIEGADACVERQFHALFRELHERGEWFTNSQLIQAVIREIQAGEFDWDSLPQPRKLQNRGREGWTPEQKQRASYAQRIWRLTDRCGFSFPYDLRSVEAAGRYDVADAFLEAPHIHGKPIPAGWAKEKRAEWLASLEQVPA